MAVTTLPNLACGVRRLIDYAISAHVKHYQGRHPQRIELHPEHAPALYAELHPNYCWSSTGLMVYRHVEIVIAERVGEPCLITCRNEVEPL